MSTDLAPQATAALGRIASGLFILTVGPEAMLASWVQQCSFAPPRVSVAVQPGRPIFERLQPDAIFGLSIFPEGKTDWLKQFGKGVAPGEDPFANVPTFAGEHGVTLLSEALAVLECRTIARHEVGDHHLLIGELLAGRVLIDGVKPMTHSRKSGLHY